MTILSVGDNYGDDGDRLQSDNSTNNPAGVTKWKRISWARFSAGSTNETSSSSSSGSRMVRMKYLLGHTSAILLSLIIFLLLSGACIAIVLTISRSQKDALAEEARLLALETGNYFSDQLDRAILPLFSIAQFALHLETFQDLPDKIGEAGEPGALPFLPQVEGSERVHRNVTGVCDDPEMVSRFISIATAIKEQSKMDDILVNIQLAPKGVICLLHPMNNTADFEDGKFLDNTGAWGLDLLNDPFMKYIALGSIDDENVVVAGPRPLVQCPTCGDFFIARLPIVDPRHEIVGLDGISYPRWGFATALIDWSKLVERSGIKTSFTSDVHDNHSFSQDPFEFQLTRTDYKYNKTTDTYESSVIVLAESNAFQGCDVEARWHSQISVALETTNSEWEMHVRYSEADIVQWMSIVLIVCILLSFVISWLIYTVLIQKQMHADMQALTSAQEAKVETERNMTAYFAHELRNPLSAMDSALHVIVEEELPKNSRELVKGMKLCASFMGSIMNNLLDARKLQEGMMEIRYTPLSLSELLESVFQMMLPLVKSNVELKLENNVPKERDWVLGDSHRIQQVLTNMVTNSIKYTFVGSITLRVSWTDDKQVRLDVIDTGPGIPKNEQERLFERFVQRGGAPGTGLGLAISKEIVSIMGGTIYFESDPTVQPGTDCIVILPLEECAPIEDDEVTEISPVDETKPIQAPIRILLMDDIKMNRMMLERRLKKAIAPNAEISMAVNGEEALEIVSQRSFDIIICDQYMEQAGGVLVGTDVIIAMRRERINALIVGCSGNDLDAEFQKAGADLVWGKPMPSNEEIIQQFRQGLRDRQII